MNKLKLLALALLLCVGGKAFAQGLGYGYPTMPQIHQAVGGGAKAAASPTPAFTAGNTIATASNPVVTAGSTTNGDFCINVAAGESTVPTTPVKWWQTTAASAYSAGADNWVYAHTVTTDEAASTTWTNGGGPVCQVCYSHTLGALDLAATSHTGAGVAAAQCPAVTTTLNNELVVCVCADTNGTGTTTWGSPSAGTLRESVNSVSGTTRGCAISDQVQATAGTVAAVNYTLSTAIDTACVTLAIQQR